MWQSSRQTPAQLAAISVGGVVLYTLMAAIVALLSSQGLIPSFAREAGLTPLLLRLGCGIFLLIPGVAIGLRALSLLREGVRLDRWSEKDLDALRAKVDRPVWTVLSWSLFTLLALLLISLPVRSSAASAWLFLWAPMYLISDLRSALRKPISPRAGTIDWSTVKPLQSEQWGRVRH